MVYTTRMKTHSPQDHIYGPLKIPSYCWQIIDTREFQRLRYIKQLGGSFIVYPGANHTRFEHSLGCCHLANVFMATVKENQPELVIKDEYVQAVVLAALCHDLGHGPFSHVFDTVARQVPGFDSWQAVDMSETMFRHILKKHKIQFSIDVVEATCAFILGHKYEPWPAWLSQVVRNQKTSIDVNTMDYLARDSKRTLNTSMFTFWRLVSNCRVLKPREDCEEEELCWKLSEAPTIEAMFHARNEMYMAVYYHKVCQALGVMLQDMFFAMFDDLCIEDYLTSPKLFTQLDDRILYRAEKGKYKDKAQKIAMRIKRRKLYQCIGETVVQRTNARGQTLSQMAPKDLVESLELDMEKAKDLRVIPMRYTYGQSETQNPLLQTTFWNLDHDGNRNVFKLTESDISCIRPREMTDTRIRFFCTSKKSRPTLEALLPRIMKEKLKDI